MSGGMAMVDRRAGLLQALRTVLSALIGVRHRRMHDEDSAGLRPIQVIVAGVVVVAVFVMAIIAFVQLVAIK